MWPLPPDGCSVSSSPKCWSCLGDQTDWVAPARAAIRDAEPVELLAALERRLQVRPVSPLIVLGFAETATSLGHLVADQLHAGCYLHSTRRVVPGVRVAGTFE
jgi:hypothetical protein